MSDRLTPTLSAFIAKIKGDPAFAGLIGVPPRVFDHVPSVATFPYLVVQVVEERDVSAKDYPVQSLLIAIQVFHRAHDGAQVRQIVAALYACLQDASLENVARCQEEFTGIFPSKDSTRAITRYRVIVS